MPTILLFLSAALAASPKCPIPANASVEVQRDEITLGDTILWRRSFDAALVETPEDVAFSALLRETCKMPEAADAFDRWRNRRRATTRSLVVPIPLLPLAPIYAVQAGQRARELAEAIQGRR